MHYTNNYAYQQLCNPNALHKHLCLYKQCNPNALLNYAYLKQCNPNAFNNYAYHKQYNFKALHNFIIKYKI